MNYRILLTLLTLTLLLVFGWSKLSTSVNAGTNQWTSNGPAGGDIVCLTIDPVTPTTLYACDVAGGIFKSSNSGATWTSLNAGLPFPPRAAAIAIDPVSPTTLYLSTYSGGVFKSIDAGVSWTAINNGLDDTDIQVLAVDPVSPNIVFAGRSFKGLHKSTDGGASWAPSNSGLPAFTFVSALTFDPSDHNTIYLGNFALYKSTDGGASWLLSSNGLPTDNIKRIIVKPELPNIMYVGTDRGVFRSTDSGANWADFSSGLPNPYAYVRSLAMSPGVQDVLYAGTYTGMFKSLNGGAWVQVGLYSSSVQAVVIDPTNPSKIYAGTGEHTFPDGIFISFNAGLSWAPRSAGLNDSFVEALANNPSSPFTIYAGDRIGGVFNRGASDWIPRNANLPIQSAVLALAVAPDSPNTAYVSISDGSSPTRGIYATTDGGQSWQFLASVVANCILIDPNQPNVLYAGTTSGVLKSIDGGQTWMDQSIGLLAASPQSKANSAVTPNFLIAPGLSVQALAFSPQNSSTLYAGTSSGVYTSVNSGSSWTKSDNTFSVSVNSLAIDALNPANIYAAALNSGVFKSSDGGASFSPIMNGLPNTGLWALAVDPTSPNVIYVGADAEFHSIGGVYRSTDGGNSWSDFNAGLPNLSVKALVISPDGSQLYAGTSGGGVFEYTLGRTGCSLSCAASASANAFAGSDVSFSGSANPSSCSDVPSYDWDFGDNSAHSSEQSPTHAYATPGTYTWAMTATVAGGDSCTQSGTITVSAAPRLTLSISGPSELGAFEGHYSPNPFTVTATVKNDLPDATTNTALQISLPSSLTLASGTTSVSIGSLGAGEELQVSWDVRAAAQTTTTNVSVTVTANATGLSTSSASHTITLPGLPSRRPVLFIPGVYGTELKNGDELLWLDLQRALDSFTDTFLDPLQFQTNLNPLDFSVVPGNVTRRIQGDWRFPGTSQVLQHEEVDYTDSLITELVNNGYTEGFDLVMFPYDWRFGINDGNVAALGNAIRQIKMQTGAEKVDVIAHSTGGVLLKRYVQQSATNDISKVIFLGVPNLGAPKATDVLLTGDAGLNRQGVGVANREMKKLAPNMPIVYDLSPSIHYFAASGSFMQTRSPFGRIQNLDFLQTKDLLIQRGGNEQAFNNSTVLHSAALDSFDLRTKGIDFYNIVGDTNNGTVIRVKEQQYLASPPEYDVDRGLGDGTVPIASATNIPVDPTHLYYTKAEHGSMPSDSGVRQQIANILKNDPNTLAPGISRSIKLTYNATVLFMASPVDLLITDQSGNYAGPTASGSYVNAIPGVDYTVLGEHKSIYLPSDEGQTYSIKLRGTGDGTFTLKVTTIQSSQETQSEIYPSLPVTPSLLGELVFPNAHSQLQLDNNGDGQIDQILAPPVTLNQAQLATRQAEETGDITLTAPQAQPVAGTYATTQVVSLSNPGWDMFYYSLDGSEPSCGNGRLYSGPIVVASSNTIKAVGCRAEGMSSTGVSFVYVINRTTPLLRAPGNVTVSTAANASSCATTVSDSVLGNATLGDSWPGVTITRTGVPPNNLLTVGVTTITYTATDSFNNVATVMQTVTVRDATRPTITLNGPNTLTVEACTAFNDPGATAMDACAGNLSSAISRSGNVNTSTTGTYVLHYNVSDPSGNAAVEVNRTVKVVDSTPPTVVAPQSLSAPSDINCQAPIPNIIQQVVASDSCSGVILQQSPTAGTLVGVGPHTITITARDAAENARSVTTTFTVVAGPSFVVSVSPSSVKRGSQVTLSTSFHNCANSRQGLMLRVSLVTPRSNDLMLTLPLTLQAGQRGSVNIPLIIPRATPTGLYSLTLDVYVGGTRIGSSTAQLTVLP